MDRYQALREAALAATTGPWERHDTGGFVRCVRQVVSGRGICSTFVQNQPKTPAGWENQRHQNNANSDYIAAANPATVQALLAERDALREVLDSIRQYGSDTLSGRADGGADDRKWQRDAVVEMTRRARIALSLK